jgi:flagellar biosynthesis component FlhA
MNPGRLQQTGAVSAPKKKEDQDMGIFGDDKIQDVQIEALQSHVRKLTEDVQQNQLDLADIRISLMTLQGALKEKLSVADVDPDLLELNKDLAEARQESEKVAAAAEESWNTLQKGASESFKTLRDSIQKAAERLTQE